MAALHRSPCLSFRFIRARQFQHKTLPGALLYRRSYGQAPSRVSRPERRISLQERLHRARISGSNRDEDVYQFWLNIKIRLREPIPLCADLLALDRDSCRNALPPAFKDNPLLVFRHHGTANELDVVGQCLNCYVAEQLQRSISKEARREQYVTDKPGTRALHWLLQSGAYHSFDFVLSTHFVTALTHCLVAEGQEEYLWVWMTADERPAFAQAGDPRDRNKWGGMLLRAMVESQAFWSQGPKILETPMKSYFRAWPARPSPVLSGSQRSHHVAPQVAGTWLIRQLTSARRGEVDPALFDDFTGSLGWSADRDLRDFQRSSLRLHHPKGADPYPALAFLQRCACPEPQSIYIRNLLNPRFPEQAWAVLWYMIHTAQALAKCGQPEHARWVLNFCRQSLPDMLLEGQTPKGVSEKDNSKLTTIRWQPDEEVGVRTDYGRVHHARRASGR